MMQQHAAMTETGDTARSADPGTLACTLAEPPALRALTQDDAGAPPLALFLDFDGTLVEIAAHPDDVEVDPRLPDLLTRLDIALEGRLAVISGRSLAVLDRFLGPIGIAMAGSHGGELRLAGSEQVQALADPLDDTVAGAMEHFARKAGGLLFERKPFSVAVHYRAHPEARDALLDCARALADRHGLGLKHGKMVVELAMPGSDKGSAVTRFMELPRFADARPVFAGDDVTDEDAFAIVKHFGGSGILVGPMRETRAIWRLEDVDALHRWLALD